MLIVYLTCVALVLVSVVVYKINTKKRSSSLSSPALSSSSQSSEVKLLDTNVQRLGPTVSGTNYNKQNLASMEYSLISGERLSKPKRTGAAPKNFVVSKNTFKNINPMNTITDIREMAETSHYMHNNTLNGEPSFKRTVNVDEIPGGRFVPGGKHMAQRAFIREHELPQRAFDAGSNAVIGAEQVFKPMNRSARRVVGNNRQAVKQKRTVGIFGQTTAASERDIALENVNRHSLGLQRCTGPTASSILDNPLYKDDNVQLEKTKEENNFAQRVNGVEFQENPLFRSENIVTSRTNSTRQGRSVNMILNTNSMPSMLVNHPELNERSARSISIPVRA